MGWNGGWSKGGSWGKGWNKGWGKSRGGGNGKPLPEGDTVDKTKKYEGVVEKYSKWSGFGWIKMKQTGVVPDDKVFLYWKSIKSDDRFPTVNKDMAVEFGLHPYKSKTAEGKTFVRAKVVTLPGGGAINVQEKQDAEKKTFIGKQDSRYKGTLKFFKKSEGFGYITLDDAAVTALAKTEPVPKELRVEAAEFNAGGEQPFNIKKKDIAVEFGVWKTQKGVFKAYNMTLPKGKPFTQQALEGREAAGTKMYTGTVSKNMWKQGYGYIDVDASPALPNNVKAKLQEADEAAKAKGRPVTENSLYFRSSDLRDNQWLKKGDKVEFKVYVDEKGAGAMDIHPK